MFTDIIKINELMIHIRKAGPADYDIINALAAIIWPHTYSTILSKEQLDFMFEMMYSREAYNSQITEKGHYFLLAEKNDKYLGFASYEPDHKPGITKIHKLYILPDLQRSGVGQALLKAITNYALQNGNKKITLNVNRYNTALHFYEAKGFANIAQEDINIGNGYLMEDYIMEKSI